MRNILFKWASDFSFLDSEEDRELNRNIDILRFQLKQYVG